MEKSCIIIDDAGFIREMIRNITTELGYKVLAEGASGKDSLGLVEIYSPDLLFLDLVLPDQNGLDLLRKLRGLNPNIKVAICTSLVSPNIQEEVLTAGADYFLKKPFSKSDVLKILERASKDIEA